MRLVRLFGGLRSAGIYTRRNTSYSRTNTRPSPNPFAAYAQRGRYDREISQRGGALTAADLIHRWDGIGFFSAGALLAQSFAVPPAQTCTVTDIRGNPISGKVCGGTTHGLNCTAGAIYNCTTKSSQNNCTLAQACSRGCLTNSTLNDACFSGTFAPIIVSPLNTTGGSDLSVTLELDKAHPNGAYVNLKIDRGDLVPGAYCAPPFELPGGQNTTTFGLSSAVVNVATPVHIYSDLSYTDSSGVSRQLASTVQTVTLNPGGTAPPTPPLASFTMSPSTIGPAGESLVTATLSRMAPANGVQVPLPATNRPWHPSLPPASHSFSAAA